MSSERLGRCEICEADAFDGCAGLDVPALYFCPDHIEEHLANCPDVNLGQSWRVVTNAHGGLPDAD